ncbi:uncharacterized protein [Dermacentor andersoni]|uniref:uncharacterized protein n=1 Tax=Dermacentor andersoni TaxID=34620 RepID=UPI002415E691|nr:uncharacterized protein LOC129383063 [Dermacentor andersoni]
MLATKKIQSYGVLNIVTKPGDFAQAVHSMEPVVAEMKKIQGSDPDKRTVIAFGSYDYSENSFMDLYKNTFAAVVGSFKVDTVIAISSVGSIEGPGSCSAVPPTVLISPMPKFPSLKSHWHLVRANATGYINRRVWVGLSFEMGALIYALKQDARNLNSSAYAECTDFGMTSRDAICATRKYVDRRDQHLKSPYIIYGTFLTSTNRHVVFAEYHTTVRDKYTAARRRFGSLRKQAALMIFNVHLGDVRKKCGTDAFTIIKWICEDFRGVNQCN